MQFERCIFSKEQTLARIKHISNNKNLTFHSFIFYVLWNYNALILILLTVIVVNLPNRFSKDSDNILTKISLICSVS